MGRQAESLLLSQSNASRDDEQAAKSDIAAIEFSLADLDPAEGETSEAAKARYLPALKQYKPSPTATVDSGNGVQALWRLAAPIQLSAWKQVGDKVESQSKPPSTKPKLAPQNSCWILAASPARKISIASCACPYRQSAKCEKAKRWAHCLSRQADQFQRRDLCARRFSAGRYRTAAGDIKSSDKKKANAIDWDKVKEHEGWLTSVDKLPESFSQKGRMIVVHGGSLADLVYDLKNADPPLLTKDYQSWSEVSLALTAIFKADGRFSNEKIAAALMCDLECNRHISALKDQTRSDERSSA